MKDDYKSNEKDKNEEGESDDDYCVEIDNLNINQEVEIKENPKKHYLKHKKQEIQSSSYQKSKSSNKHITYDDIYLGDEMLITRPNSIPKNYKNNNKILKGFVRMYSSKSSKQLSNKISRNTIGSSTDINTSNDNNVSNFILDEEEEEECEYGKLRKNSFDISDNESSHLKDYIASINNFRENIKENNMEGIDEKEMNFVDEDEQIDKNIFLVENESDLNNLNYYSKKNKCNISYISINLYIKKLCTENLKDKFPILYKSFISQYQEFLPISTLVEKLIEAFDYFYGKMKIEIPDLIRLLNQILSKQFKEIEKNEQISEKLKNLYDNLDNIHWIDESLRKEISNVDSILSSNTNDDFDLQYTKYLISDRRKSKAIVIKAGRRSMNLKNKAPPKISYFSVLDFTEEEIARNLTLISYKMMSSIDINELLNNNFGRDDKYSKAPNVMKLIDRFDKMMLFIIEDINSYETSKTKAKLITKWANIAKRCKELHNYNDLLIINQCFNNPILKKMISAWKKLPKTTLTLINELNKFCSNQQCYINIRREIVNRKHTAYIPYLGIVLKEIADIENRYQYIEKFDNNICMNCIKLQKIYWVVNKFFEFKNYSFSFTQIDDLKILDKLNPKTKEELEDIVTQNEKSISTFKELILSGNKKKQTKTDELYYGKFCN